MSKNTSSMNAYQLIYAKKLRSRINADEVSRVTKMSLIKWLLSKSQVGILNTRIYELLKDYR